MDVQHQILTIAGWNMRSLNSAGPYMHELSSAKKADIICVAEHRLYENELNKLNDLELEYDFIAKSSTDLKNYDQSRQAGHCGLAIFWRKSWNPRICSVISNSDRICAIEILKAYGSLSLFYYWCLPSSPKM